MKSLFRITLLQLTMLAACCAQSGFVKSGGQAIPGATITVTQQSQTLSTVTDADGHYTFPPLAAGPWSVTVDMFGFSSFSKSVDFSTTPAPVNLDLELKPSQMLQRLQQRSAQGGGFPGGPPSGQGAGQSRGPAQRPAANATGTTQIDQQIQAELSAQQTSEPSTTNSGEGATESFLVSGSLSPGMSQGAQADSGPEMRFGGPGGLTDAAGNPSGSPFAQQGANGAGDGGGGFPGGGGGGGGFGGGGGGGFGGGGGGRGGGGGGGGFGGPGGRNGRGQAQNRGQFGNFRRRNQQIRGQASFTLQNSALNAKPFSLNGLDVPQAAYAQSRFSLILGGPLVIPKLVKDPSTQFFLTYFGTRQRAPRLFTETVPTAAERNGDFSQATQSLGTNATNVPVVIYDPTTHQPVPGNRLPVLNQKAVQLLNTYFPLPNEPGNANNYQFETAQPSDTDNVGFRIQRNITKKDRLSANIQFQRRDANTPQAFGYSDTSSGYGLTTSLGWTRNITTNVLSNLQFRFSRNRNQLTPYFSTQSNVETSLAIPGTSSNPLNYGPPTLNFTNFGALTDGVASLTRAQSQGFTEAISIIHGAHSFSIGGGFTRPDRAILSDPNGRGTFNFTGVATSQINAAGQAVSGTGYDLADFLLGYPQSSSIQYSGQNDYYIQNQFNLYVQDEWKIRSNFTAILGMRYEYFAPIHEKYGRLANLDIAPGYAAVAQVVAGGTGPYSGAFPGGLVNPDRNNFSPRLAIAWKLTQFKRSTVLRAGYGIYYNPQAYLGFASRLANQPPFANSSSINTSASDVLTLNAGFLTASPSQITNTFAIDRNYRTPYAGTWDLFLQRDLGGGFFTEMGYLGTKGTRLDVYTIPNQAPPGSAIALAQRNQLGNATGFTYDQSVGNSIFNAFHVRFNRRFNHGLSFQAFYQLAKSIDDASTLGGGANVAQNWLDIQAERGLSNFDVRHSFTLGFVWTSPVGGPGSHMAADTLTGRLLKDWQLTGNLTAHSGNPLTAKVLGNSQQLAQTNGAASGRAEATGLPISGSSGQFFNLDAFTLPITGTYGNAGVNTITGPGLFSMNLAFARSFNLSERRRLEFRVETNNTLNNVNYTGLYTVVNATNYGLPSSAGSMRTVDAVVRFRF